MSEDSELVPRASSLKSRASGLTLIEILIATSMMAAVLIPVATLIMGGLRRTEVSKHAAIAMAMGSNMLDEMLSPNLPFGAIDPTGQCPDGGVKGADLPKTLPSAGNRRAQACFRNVTGGPAATKLEKVLSDRQTPTRIKLSPEGLEFEIFLFAGIYADSVQSKPDLENELTFSYLANPHVKPDNLAQGQKILAPPAQVAQIFPYTKVPVAKVTNPITVFDYYPGWPQPPSGYAPSPTQLKDDIRQAFTEFDSNSQQPAFHAFYEDQRKFGKPDGGLMKLILGIRWNPNTHVTKGVGYTKNTKELWLVSFKADLLQH
jgi:hypothetical protein